MIDKLREEQAALFVLDLLEEPERADFEAALRQSAELQGLVRELARGLYEPARTLAGPDRPELLSGIMQRVMPAAGRLPQAVSAAQAGKAGRFRWSYIWAAAALLMIGLNLVLLLSLGRAPAGDPDGAHAAVRDAELPGSLSRGYAGGAAGSHAGFLEARITRLEQDLVEAERALEAARRQGEQLAAAREEEVGLNSEWQMEYARLAARFLPFFEPNDGMSRFTVIEMVDAEAFEQALPRRGFAELAGRFLSGEGNIAGVGQGEFIGPVADGAGVASASVDVSRAGLMPMARGDAVALPGAAAAGTPAQVEAADPATAEAESRPAGFTVWRDDEQKGFLDLYNLPEADIGQRSFLWVRSSELEAYIPVGILPELDNGTGSLFYSVDEPNFTPTEILITAEPEGVDAVVPSGPVLLRGP
jgi:hypothetical protein